MKITSLLLLCLFLISCKQQEVNADNKGEICPLAMILPYTEVHMNLNSPGKKYMYTMDGQVLWDDCANDSELNIYEIQFLPGHGSILAKKIFRGMFPSLSNSSVNVSVFEFDNSCQLSTNPVFNQNIVPRTQIQIVGGGVCAEEIEHLFLDAEIN